MLSCILRVSYIYANSSRVYKLVISLIGWKRLLIDIIEVFTPPLIDVVNCRGLASKCPYRACSLVINLWSCADAIVYIGVGFGSFVPEFNWKLYLLKYSFYIILNGLNCTLGGSVLI